MRVHTTNDKPDRSEDRQTCANDADDCFHSQPVLINALIVMTSIGGEPLPFGQSNQRGID
ncbi:hypothetical protein [Sphingopyxis macrogoltabida]|uniref:hypothetical protein n=1 Tax=Sphingopyxis macrogoltabida TaxID=33050 RepID=UPI0011EA6F11|nr:hypothetical protein [Sphingopyxis macrogoltabida]